MTEKNPDQTRAVLLEAAFDEIYRNGFHHTSLDAILAKTGLTKGALYHHFENKDALGLAVVDEVIGGFIRELWVTPLATVEDPIDGLLGAVRHESAQMDDDRAKHGCPMANMVQEMSAVNDEFREHLGSIYAEWQGAIESALRRGQEKGFVREDLDPRGTALMVVATLQGAAGMMKSGGGMSLIEATMGAFAEYLESLRPQPVTS